MMNFRTFDDMSSALANKLSLIPRDVDLIVGIPRSGLIPANILALHLNLPLTDLDGLISGRMLGKGRTRSHTNQRVTVGDCRKVLVIDDSVWTGKTIIMAKQKIERAGIPQEVIYAAVYVSPETKDQVDLYFDICPFPRMFEWNFMHHGYLEKACLDIDGVLCEDPTSQENDDGLKYLEFLENAKPLLIPTLPVGNLVTSRLEKYRPQTENWLEKQGIKYEKLFMLDLPDSTTRRALNNHAHFKSQIYRQTKSIIFIESELKQAIDIAKYSGKPVLCTENRRLVYPDGMISAEIQYRQKQINSNLKQLKRRLRPLRDNMSRLLRRK
ncbi:phosphoribosyltransferase family protein [Myxosarcina sp. GI1(2024)]